MTPSAEELPGSRLTNDEQFSARVQRKCNLFIFIRSAGNRHYCIFNRNYQKTATKPILHEI
jgi:hypothetical protein